jgi:hypothetical protein
MKTRPLDALLVLGVGLCVFGAVFVGARAEGGAPAPSDRQRVLQPHGALLEQGRNARKGVDPFRPPGLPPGVGIDPETGLMLGLDLKPADGEQAPSWALLAKANAVSKLADLPASVRALDGKRVVFGGFMMALYALRDIREFALVGSHTKCCFGIPPGVGDQIVVRIARRAEGLALTLAPLRVAGTFRIRPQHLYRDGSGPLIWLYEIVGARVVPYGG